jgi:hypothetical protein
LAWKPYDAFARSYELMPHPPQVLANPAQFAIGAWRRRGNHVHILVIGGVQGKGCVDHRAAGEQPKLGESSVLDTVRIVNGVLRCDSGFVARSASVPVGAA